MKQPITVMLWLIKPETGEPVSFAPGKVFALEYRDSPAHPMQRLIGLTGRQTVLVIEQLKLEFKEKTEAIMTLQGLQRLAKANPTATWIRTAKPAAPYVFFYLTDPATLQIPEIPEEQSTVSPVIVIDSGTGTILSGHLTGMTGRKSISIIRRIHPNVQTGRDTCRLLIEMAIRYPDHIWQLRDCPPELCATIQSQQDNSNN